MQVCNSTCLSLSRPDPRCGVEDAPVEGCGCLEGTHLTGGLTCTPKAQCPCHHQGGVTPPGPVIIDGRQWWVPLTYCYGGVITDDSVSINNLTLAQKNRRSYYRTCYSLLVLLLLRLFEQGQCTTKHKSQYSWEKMCWTRCIQLLISICSPWAWSQENTLCTNRQHTNIRQFFLC